jgi:glyoxylase-like metal-dependent hydrolase (beta-lactamase superfamily II)
MRGGDANRCGRGSRIPLNPKSVTHLFLTHGDVDHTGGLRDVALLCTAHSGALRIGIAL